jgi:predicted RNase H-like HicB family nuclease
MQADPEAAGYRRKNGVARSLGKCDEQRLGNRVKVLPFDESGGFLALVPDLPGCMSDGTTRAEAIDNVTKAIDEWIAEAGRLGRAVPAPSRRQAVY